MEGVLQKSVTCHLLAKQPEGQDMSCAPAAAITQIKRYIMQVTSCWKKSEKPGTKTATKTSGAYPGGCGQEKPAVTKRVKTRLCRVGAASTGEIDLHSQPIVLHAFN